MKQLFQGLRVSREEARQKIEAQIEKGQWLHDQQISSDDKLDQVIMESDNWSDYNTDLLITLFGSSAPVDWYINFGYTRVDPSLGYYIPTLQDEVTEYRTRMASSINSLTGIHERLELYDKPSNTSQSTFGNDVFSVHGHDEVAKQAIAGICKEAWLKCNHT